MKYYYIFIYTLSLIMLTLTSLRLVFVGITWMCVGAFLCFAISLYLSSRLWGGYARNKDRKELEELINKL